MASVLSVEREENRAESPSFLNTLHNAAHYLPFHPPGWKILISWSK